MTTCPSCLEEPVDESRTDGRCASCGADIDSRCRDCDGSADESRSDGRCRQCGDAFDRDEWLTATEDWLYDTAKAGGWSCRLKSAATTGTRYFTLERVDEDGERFEELTVRIGDHPTVHCSEDCSLSMVDGGDDHTRETVASRLSRPFGVD